MHSAPSVVFPVGRCIWYGVMFAVLAVLGVCALGAWWWLSGWRYGSGFAGALLWTTWACFAAWTWRHAPVGQLRWNGPSRHGDDVSMGSWYWHSAACPEGAVLRRVERVLDLQVVALLRLHNADALARWVWVERARDPARWMRLRRALVSASC